MQAYLNAGRDEMDLATSASHIDLQGMAREAAAGNNKQANKIKIALSLYKVQQNIYLLDFQRVEVREHRTVCLEMLLYVLGLSSNQYAVMTKLSHFSLQCICATLTPIQSSPLISSSSLYSHTHTHECYVKTRTRTLVFIY